MICYLSYTIIFVFYFLDDLLFEVYYYFCLLLFALTQKVTKKSRPGRTAPHLLAKPTPPPMQHRMYLLLSSCVILLFRLLTTVCLRLIAQFLLFLNYRFDQLVNLSFFYSYFFYRAYLLTLLILIFFLNLGRYLPARA